MMQAAEVEKLFTRSDGSYLFARWVRPIVPVVFGVEDGTLRVTGGRVLCVTALGDSTKLAQARAYDALRGIHIDGVQYRRDIGYRAIKR